MTEAGREGWTPEERELWLRPREEANVEQPICRVGSATDNPCPRVATEYVNREDRPDWCWPHLFSLRLGEAMDDIHALLEERRAELERWVFSQQADQ